MIKHVRVRRSRVCFGRFFESNFCIKSKLVKIVFIKNSLALAKMKETSIFLIFF